MGKGIIGQAPLELGRTYIWEGDDPVPFGDEHPS